MPYKAEKWFFRDFNYDVTIYITFEIRLICKFLAETFVENTTKVSREQHIMKWRPGYDIHKLFNKGLDTMYAEANWKAPYLS